jgi:redox-sensitive bicupin YhaK (pirin superfamily)
MITIRKSEDRGRFDHGWLDTRHTFSFADYWDPEHVNFRSLRVLNEDRVAPAAGFGTHGHNDMEIVSYVLEGKLAHKDSMGNGSTIVPGDVQYMSAGTGVRHSEFNASPDEPVHFVQIWIVPDRRGYAPRYGQKRFEEPEKRGRLRLVASATGQEGSIELRQDVSLYATILGDGESVPLSIAKGRHLWVQVLRGSAEVNGRRLGAGDGLAASDETDFTLRGAGAEAELLVFDLA